MGTKNNPGNFDCYTNAEPDEPMFVLLARDESAPEVVRIWIALRSGDGIGAIEALYKAMNARGFDWKQYDDPKNAEAHNCANAMEDWFTSNIP